VDSVAVSSHRCDDDCGEVQGKMRNEIALLTAVGIVSVTPAIACGGGSGHAGGGGGGMDAGFGLDSSSLPESSSGDALAMSPWDGSAIPTVVMPRISAGVPAFASGGPSTDPSNADDNSMTTSWAPPTLPAWIAYDLSGAPVAQRQSTLVVWNAEHAADYINATPPSGAQMPTDYTIEINAAPGGTSAPPSDGWVQVAAISDNLRDTVESPAALAGGNWLRMNVMGSTDPDGVAIDLDVFATPNGATDCWMLMGDSITFITFGYGFSNLPQLVNQAKSNRWPAIINAAIGGTNTVTATSIIDDTMVGYPGRYVALAYGTNDQSSNFQMETLVQKVLAAGKIPVVPLMPWSDTQTVQTNGPLINQAIQALYVKYPQILPGPDLWTAFLNRTDLIPSGDVHPNQAGQVVLRQQWANVIAAVP
jgi:hypothetical protein